MAVGQGQPAVINGAAITAQGINSALNISANTVIKASQGRVVKVNVTTAGSVAAIYIAWPVLDGVAVKAAP